MVETNAHNKAPNNLCGKNMGSELPILINIYLYFLKFLILHRFCFYRKKKELRFL